MIKHCDNCDNFENAYAKGCKIIEPCDMVLREYWKPKKVKSNKIKFILKYIKDNNHGVDILDSGFVDSYIDEFKPTKWSPTFYGAYKCPEIGRYLSKMYRDGLLKRFVISIPNGAWQVGFPKWVYHYEI